MSRIVKGSQDSPDSGSGSSRPSSSGRIVKQEVAQAHEDASDIRREAEAAASSILEEAKAEAERLKSEARETGYDEGLGEWTAKILELQDSSHRILEQNRDDLLRLSVKIAKKILGREIEADSAALADLVLKAIRGIRHQGRIQIRVRKQDLDAIRSERQRLLDELGSQTDIEFMEDASIGEGGCIVETQVGIIDARLETQLKVLEKALLQRKNR